MKRVLRQRVLIYATLLLVAVLGFVASVSLRSPFRFDVVRDRGVLARVVNDGAVENVYRLHVMNATEEGQRYRVAVLGPAGLALIKPLELALGPVQAQTVPVGVQLPYAAAAALAGQTLPIQLEVTRLGPDDALVRVREKTTFHVPW